MLRTQLEASWATHSFPIAGELEGALADWLGEGLVRRDGGETFARGLALGSQTVDQTQWLQPSRSAGVELSAATRLFARRLHSLDEDWSVLPNLHRQLKAFEQLHAYEWHCFARIDFDEHSASIPKHFAFVDVEDAFTSVREHGPSVSQPRQFQIVDQRLW